MCGSGEAVIVNGYTSAPENSVPNNKANLRRKRALRDFQNCRSLTLEEEVNAGAEKNQSENSNHIQVDT